MRATQYYDTGKRPEELDAQRPEPCETPWGSFTLYRVDGRWRAFQSFCPHLLGPLFQGTRSAETIVCPWHQWRFDLRTGACLYRPEGCEDDVPALAELVVSLSSKGTLRLAASAPANA